MKTAIKEIRRISLLKSKNLRQRLAVPAPFRADKQTVFVTGVQRSGTNMVMDVLERSWQTEVFHESDRRAFDDYVMRPPAVIGGLIDASPARWVVVKALHEAHDFAGLLDRFAPAKGIWMFRGYDDMINSNMANWPGGRNQIEDIVADRDRAGWRGKGMRDQTHATIRALYHPAMNDAAALGLFWYYRNQLFFDQQLAADRRVRLVRYEALVGAPARQVDAVARFLGLKPTAAMRRLIFAGSVAKQPPPEIEPAVRRLCDAMLARLVAAWQDQPEGGQ